MHIRLLFRRNLILVGRDSEMLRGQSRPPLPRLRRTGRVRGTSRRHENERENLSEPRNTTYQIQRWTMNISRSKRTSK